MKEIIQDARNVDEAIELACKALGVERDTIEFEIINLPKRGFLGFKNTPARVRVYVEEPEVVAPKAPAPRDEKPARSEKREIPAPQKNEPKPVREPKPASEPKPQPKKPEPKAAPKPESKPAPEPKAETPEKPSAPEVQFISAQDAEGKAKTASAYIKDVLTEMGVDATVSIGLTENGMILRLSGEGLGVIIGRRGETLDALQYLCGLVANREEGEYMRVTIDSGNYREKREHTLEQLARKLSISAIRRGRPTTLEPMNPYERRIIHATVSKIEGVTSASVGEEPGRRVVITPENVKPQAPRAGKGGGKGGRDRGPRREGDRRPAGENRDSRPPRDNRDKPPRSDSRIGGSSPRRDSAPRREGGKTDSVTSTAVDREYMKEIERDAATFVKPEPSEKPVQRESSSPAREASRKEGDDLPLYGKIEL